MIEALLQVENIFVHYGHIAAVRGVSLRVARGRLYVWSGPTAPGSRPLC